MKLNYNWFISKNAKLDIGSVISIRSRQTHKETGQGIIKDFMWEHSSLLIDQKEKKAKMKADNFCLYNWSATNW